MHSRRQYLTWRSVYLPARVGRPIRAIFVAESPPESGKYFYRTRGQRASEPLFQNLMLALYGRRFAHKEDGLRRFQESGYILTDACYSSLRGTSGTRRSRKILSGLPDLLVDLRLLATNRRTKIILIKSNVCDLLEPVLATHGFKIANGGVRIPFPSGHQPEFRRRIRSLLPAHLTE